MGWRSCRELYVRLLPNQGLMMILVWLDRALVIL